MTGRSVRLCALDRRHVERTRAWANDAELMALLDRARLVSDAEHEEWFQSLQRRTDCVYCAVEVGTEAVHVGNVWLWGIDQRHRKAELRIVIGDRTEIGRGVGAEAIGLMTKYAFERLNLHRVYAAVLATNPRAIRAFGKAGFVVEGTLRGDRWTGSEFADVLLLGRLREAS